VAGLNALGVVRQKVREKSRGGWVASRINIKRWDMGLFGKKVVREIRDAAWGELVTNHGMTVDFMGKELRAVEKEGEVPGVGRATLLRVFRLAETKEKGIEVSGWEVFDQHPELIWFEGYLTYDNKSKLVKKREGSPA
jgi:hypothetical protein